MTTIGETIGGKYRLERLLGDGGMGAVFAAENLNTGRRVAAAHLDAHTRVKAFVKNDHLGLSIPYRFQEGEEGHQYMPDFLVVVDAEDGQETKLILEVKGYRHNQVMAKHQAARKWVDVVNREGAWGRWAFDVAWDPKDVPKIVERVAK